MGKILFLFFSYLIGSIPFGYIICKVFKKIDIRNFGSGNIGATNVYRICGWKYGLPVLITDILKGFLPIFIGKHLNFPILLIIAGGVFSVLGHSFSLFLKFKGGKGVSTSFGVIIGLFPIPALFSFIIWVVIFLTTGYVSLSSIAGAFSLPILINFFIKDKFLTFLGILIFFFIIFTHRENIKRLLRKQENRIILPWEKK